MLDPTVLPLTNSRATLRRMSPADASAYAAGTEDPVTRAWAHLPQPEYTPESVTALIHGPIADGLAAGTLAVLTIADPKTDAFAGSLVVFNVAETATGSTAELGFWLGPDHRGRGRVGAAIELAAEFARRSGIRSLTARTLTDNVASIRSLERAGFAPLGDREDTAPSGASVRTRHFVRELPAAAELQLTSERLTLRPVERADTESLLSFYSQPGVARYLLEEPWSPEDAHRALTRRLPQVSLSGIDHSRTLVVEHDGRVIGDVQLWLTDPERGQAELGWVLDPAAGGAGFATEAVSAVIAWAFREAGLHRVVAQLDARNTASARLAERVGMRREAHFMQNWWSKGEWTDTLVYAALRDDVVRE